MSDAYPVVILGAGLTGLSAAYHLDAPSVVIEREAEVGGLARTHIENGFTFDCTGHLLHLKDPRVVALVDAILPDAFSRHERRALVFSKGVYTPYPFQANLHGLPPEVVQECVGAFVEALVRRAAEGEPDPSRLNFRDWTERSFGAGIARHFLVPYNTKLWRTDLDEIECGWVSWSIPRPTLKEVLDGAFGTTVRGLGYNPTFLYPRRGGIIVLPEALARRGAEVRFNETVTAVDAAARAVHLAGGRVVRYERLVSTLPLDRLLAITRGLPAGLPEIGGRLRAVRGLHNNPRGGPGGVSRGPPVYFPAPHHSFFPGARLLVLPGRLPVDPVVRAGAARLLLALRGAVAPARRAVRRGGGDGDRRRGSAPRRHPLEGGQADLPPAVGARSGLRDLRPVPGRQPAARARRAERRRDPFRRALRGLGVLLDGGGDQDRHGAGGAPDREARGAEGRR